MEQSKTKPALHITISDCPNCGNLRNESWYFLSFESKRMENYLLYLSGPLKYKGQIYLSSPQTFMLELQSITGVIVIDLIINYNNSSETVSVQRHGRELDGILPNIRLSMPNDEDEISPTRKLNRSQVG